MKKIFFLLMKVAVLQAAGQTVPTFEQVISLRGVGNPALSPDGKLVAFTVQTADWNENRYDTEIWIYKEGKKPFSLPIPQRAIAQARPSHQMASGLLSWRTGGTRHRCM
jgi:hypothetical protein